MKITLKHITWLVAFISIQQLSFGQTQKILSELWKGTGGTGAMFYKNSTAIDDTRNVYVAGSTINGINSDVIIQKFSRSGTLMWSQTYAATPLSIPYYAPVELLVGNSINGLSGVYILSTLYDTISTDLDLMIKKYDTSGVLQWTYLHNHPSQSIDFGTAIATNGTSIFVTGATLNDSTMADFMTISLDASTGALQWETRYDNSNLQEYPAKIIHNSGTVYVTGASQDSLTGLSWSIATVGYNATTGAQISSSRINSNAVSGVDDITDFATDNQNNLYLVGAKYGNTTSLDVALYKLDESLNLLWENFYDFNGLDDKGTGLKVDGTGNIFVTGYSTTTSEGTQVAVLKLNNSGQVVWKTELGGVASANDKGVNLVVKGEKLFVAASVVDDNNSNYKLYAMDTSGILITEATYSGYANLNDTPQGITIDNDGDIIITGKEQIDATTYINKTIKYIFDEKTSILALDTNDVPLYVENELIIRFDRSVVNTETVDKKGFLVGNLSDFVDSSAIASLNTKMGTTVDKVKTYKIFQRMTTADSISISRLGDTVMVGDFWATFLITFSGDNNELAIADSLNTLKEIIHYAEPNYIGEIFSAANDPKYVNDQTGLSNVIHGINVENAWKKQVGRNFVKVGVFDTGINWRHEDFGDGTWNGSKIQGGWDYYNNIHPSNQITPDANGHGTACAGIIGALRNNNTGIAGIAGGDVQNNNNGVQIFSQKIAQGSTTFVTNAVTSSAIVEGAISNPNTNYGYGLHIQSHSWGGPYSATLREGVKSAYRNGCILSVASGNTSNSQAQFPASLNDSWVMKVGANNSTGARADFSTYGNSLDFIAPGTYDIYSTLDHDNNSGYSYNHDGTSFACPHVSGVAALMYSQHNPYTSSQYPNVLAPEDVEVLLQSFATDVGPLGYDSENGYGRINAEESLNRASLPYRIRHYQHTVNTASAVLHASDQNVTFPEGIPGLAQGFYVGSTDIYKVQVTLPHTIPSSETYLNGWVRNAACDLFGLTNTVANPHWSGVIMNSSNQNNASLTGYIYKAKIFNVLGQYIQDRWFPVNQNANVNFGYSIYTIDDEPNVGLEEIKQGLSINLFPNPTTNELSFEFEINASNVYLEIFDISGRHMHSYNFNNLENGVHFETIDVTKFSEGLYLCKFSVGDKHITRRFIKK